MHIGLFCFRRDLRLHDNLALNQLAEECDAIVPVFCLDPRQLKTSQNPYYSPHSVKFMFESLMDLDRQIAKHNEHNKTTKAHLTLLLGQPDVCLVQLASACLQRHDSTDVTTHVTVAWNEDNTPFSKHRDELTTQALKKAFSSNVNILTNPDDVTIVPVRHLRTGAGGKYQKFTPFYEKALKQGVHKPQPLPNTPFLTLPQTSSKCKQMTVADLFKRKTYKHVHSTQSCVKGGRDEALDRLTEKYIQQRCSHYNTERNHTWEEKTTRLSAYFKFGCVSFREAYHSICDALHQHHPVACEALTRELFWNAFYAYVTYSFPHVLDGQLAQATTKKRTRKQGQHTTSLSNKEHSQPSTNKEMLEHLQGKLDATWNQNREHLQRWKDGKTGFPYVDAAMRQLLTTGWMHNRARMVVASFLIKDLRIDWREGEQHFAQHLVDYDPSANNGGWQWAASTGADAMQYRRIFNPWTQSKKFDPQAVYIKTYVKEFADPKLPAKDIHAWDEPNIRDKYENHPTVNTYPAPMVDHSQARKETLAVWKSLTLK